MTLEFFYDEYLDSFCINTSSLIMTYIGGDLNISIRLYDGEGGIAVVSDLKNVDFVLSMGMCIFSQYKTDSPVSMKLQGKEEIFSFEDLCIRLVDISQSE